MVGTDASPVLDATLTSLGTITVELPETTSRTITSAILVIYFQDIITATGGTIGESRAVLNVAGAGDNTVTETDDLTHSGENIAGGIGPFDFTSYVNTNFGAGATASFEAKVYLDQTTGTTLGFRNVWAELIITYEFDDSNATFAGMAIIPLESLVGALSTTSGSQIGTNQIPALTGSGNILDGLNGLTIMDWYIVAEGNQGNETTVDFAVSFQIDTDTEVVAGTCERALASDVFQKFVVKRTGSEPTLSAAHAWKCWSSAGTPFDCMAFTLVVAYKYTRSGSTRAHVCLQMPMEYQSPLGGTAVGNSHRFSREFLVPEPATITMHQSGVLLRYNAAASATVQFRVGAQSYRAYAQVSATVCGGFSLQHRFDSGAAGGSGLSLAKGFNTITMDAYRSAGAAANVSGLITLNYSCGIPSAGVHGGSHADITRIVESLARQQDRTATADTLLTVSDSLAIPESSYWLTAVGHKWYTWIQSAATMLNLWIRDANGWLNTYADPYVADAELGYAETYVRMRTEFLRYPTDPDPARVDVETSRVYRYASTPTSMRFGSSWIAAYHTCGHTVTLTMTNYSGDGSGIVTEWFRSDTDELIGRVTSVAGGTAQFFWYDDVTAIYAIARQSASKKGRSDDTTGSSLSIDLEPTGGGGSTYSRSRVVNE